MKLYKKEQMEGMKQNYPKEIIIELDDNYGVNREIEDMGGNITLLESKEDVVEIKANSIKGLLLEYTDIIKNDGGIDY